MNGIRGKYKYNGLWKGETLWYISKGFSKTQLIKTMPNKFRLIVRENKFHKSNDDGTPRFVFSFVDAETAEELRFGKPDTLTEMVEELAEVMRQGKHNADHIISPSESQANADALQEKAIDLIERITGEEWEFSYLTVY